MPPALLVNSFEVRVPQQSPALRKPLRVRLDCLIHLHS